VTGAAQSARRACDVAAAIAGLVVGAPVIAAVAVAVRVRHGRGVLFRQRRLGLGGRPFDLLKFRTMRHPRPGEEGPEHDAARLTALGTFLRGSSLDELPSLVNLLRGDITLVGPRPLPTQYWDRYRGVEYRRFEVKPGLTGLAQVSGRNALDWPERLALDVRYVEERSLLGDLRILAATVPVVLRRSGIAHDGAATMHELPPDRPQQPGEASQPA